VFGADGERERGGACKSSIVELSLEPQHTFSLLLPGSETPAHTLERPRSSIEAFSLPPKINVHVSCRNTVFAHAADVARCFSRAFAYAICRLRIQDTTSGEGLTGEMLREVGHVPNFSLNL
jgi:hypothetical protein